MCKPPTTYSAGNPLPYYAVAHSTAPSPYLPTPAPAQPNHPARLAVQFMGQLRVFRTSPFCGKSLNIVASRYGLTLGRLHPRCGIATDLLRHSCCSPELQALILRMTDCK